MISPRLCIKCKGKLLCGLKSCPVLEKHAFFETAAPALKSGSFSGSSPPSVFVSWRNYPRVAIAPLAPPIVEDTSLLDFPEKWFGLPQEKIIAMRQQLIRPNKRLFAVAARNPSYELTEMQELAMSFKPVTVHVGLKKKLFPTLSFDEGVAPLGPSGLLEAFSLEENPSIPRKVDYLTSDTNVKAQTALMELYNSGIPVSALHKLLSVGVLGVRKKRRLVPTRWAISAVDSSVSKALVEEKVKGFKQLGEWQLFHSYYLDNSFWVLLAPSTWAFEQLECWLPNSSWAVNAKEVNIIQDHELYSGRKTYASNVEGAYYAARLAVAEHLVESKRQAACIVFREIGPNYKVPLGVWQIRENVRHALQHKPFCFSSLPLALGFLSRKLRVPIERYKRESKLLSHLLHQRSLVDFTSRIQRAGPEGQKTKHINKTLPSQ